MPLRPPNLVDLSTFGIRVDNIGDKCCRCGQSTIGFSEHLKRADELCGDCYYMRIQQNGRAVTVSRYETMFYRPRTVWVMPPQMRQTDVIVIWNGYQMPPTVERIQGVVKIDGKYYLTRGSNLYVRGVLIRQFALHLEESQLHRIYAVQQRTV